MKGGKSARTRRAEAALTAFSQGKWLFFQAFEVFPKGLVLLDERFFGKREFKAEDEVGQGVLVEDVVGVEGVTGDLEVEAKLSSTKAVVGFAGADEAAHVVSAAGQVLGVDFADFLHQFELDRLGQLFQLGDDLVAEIQLIHDGKTSPGAWARGSSVPNRRGGGGNC